jgi:type IX secretion system PorP/SprF family membrane protein
MFPAFSQQTWTNGYFPFNRFLYNPAFTALNEKLQVDAQAGTYALSMPGSATQLQFNTQYHLPSTHSGLGINLYNETWGEGNPYRFNANLAYSYRHFVGKSHKYQMSYGLNAGYYRQNLTSYFAGWYSMEKVRFANLGLGLAFSEANDKFYVGMSAPIIVSIPDKNSTNYRLARFYNLSAGYRFRIRQLYIQPNLLVSFSEFGGHTSLITQFQYKWLNIGVGGNRDNYAPTVIVSAQATIKKHFTIGYTYQYSLSGLQAGRVITPQTIVLSYKRK